MYNLMTARAALFGWGWHGVIVGLRTIRRPSSSCAASVLYNTPRAAPEFLDESTEIPAYPMASG
jgi:hypothetical protein